mgnify:CR=1 FL=1
MELRDRITQNRQTVRIASAIALAAIAVRSAMKGHRLRAVLAAGGSVAVGATASTREPTPLASDQWVDVRIEDNRMQCPVCSEPIVVGQARRPNADETTVHEACL